MIVLGIIRMYWVNKTVAAPTTNTAALEPLTLERNATTKSEETIEFEPEQLSNFELYVRMHEGEFSNLIAQALIRKDT